MLHEPARDSGPDPAAKFKAGLGVKMFIVYALVYAGFVGINLLRPTWMGETVLFGLNLAIVYGFGLIVLALLLALVYDRFCHRREEFHKGGADGASGEGS